VTAPATNFSGVAPLSEHAREAARLWRRSLSILGLGLLPVVLWIAAAPLSSSVVANGFVKVDLNRRLVQHQEGGIVREVRVRDGQLVRRGEPLLVLGDVSVDANLELVRARLDAERLGVARLEAEQALATAPEFPGALIRAAREKRALAEQLEKERALFEARRSALGGQTRLLRAQRGRVAEEIAALRAQLASGGESLRLRRTELDNNRELLGAGYVSSARVGQLEAAVADYAASLEEQRSALARAQQRVAEIDLKIDALESQYRQDASDALRESASRTAQLEQELRKWTDAAERQRIVAPSSGEVIHLKYATPGAIVSPRETVAEIVPRGVPLVVEARVRTEDITRISRGQAADVRLTAFRYRATKTVAGRVAYVGGDRLIDPITQLPYYETLIETDAASLRAAGDLKLQAGMPAEVSFVGEERTVLQYLLEPITGVMRRAGRES
jgi:HlyD family secretion protein